MKYLISFLYILWWTFDEFTGSTHDSTSLRNNLGVGSVRGAAIRKHVGPVRLLPWQLTGRSLGAACGSMVLDRCPTRPAGPTNFGPCQNRTNVLRSWFGIFSPPPSLLDASHGDASKLSFCWSLKDITMKVRSADTPPVGQLPFLIVSCASIFTTNNPLGKC